MASKKGDPHIMLCLNVLIEAAKEPTCDMWKAFEREFDTDSDNHDALDTAIWVGKFWARLPRLGGKLLICPQCQIKTSARIKNCDICSTPLIPVEK